MPHKVMKEVGPTQNASLMGTRRLGPADAVAIPQEARLLWEE